jgi:hypothetical protein
LPSRSYARDTTTFSAPVSFALENVLRRDVSALEFVRAGTRLVMGVRGPSLDEVGGEPLGGQIFNVFTLRNGKIVRIEDYRLRAEALKAAEADEDSGWR